MKNEPSKRAPEQSEPSSSGPSPGEPSERLTRKARQARHRDQTCPMCHQQAPFLWTCPCGLQICDACMQRDLWGFTCNNITWVCPDCGTIRSY